MSSIALRTLSAHVSASFALAGRSTSFMPSAAPSNWIETAPSTSAHLAPAKATVASRGMAWHGMASAIIGRAVRRKVHKVGSRFSCGLIAECSDAQRDGRLRPSGAAGRHQLVWSARIAFGPFKRAFELDEVFQQQILPGEGLGHKDLVAEQDNLPLVPVHLTTSHGIRAHFRRRCGTIGTTVADSGMHATYATCVRV